MNKGNIIRSIFWGLVLILFLALGIIGIIRNNKIYNEYKSALNAISKNFNQNEIIENYKQVNNEITTTVKGKKLIVTSKSIETTEYIFKLKNGYLTTKIDKNDTFGKTIVMAIADTIAVSKGLPMSSTYSLFNNDSVLKYKLKDGIEYKNKKESYIINISLINPILNKDEINNNFNDNQNNENNTINDNDIPNNEDTNQNETNNNLNNEETNPNNPPLENNNFNEENNPNTLVENNTNYNEDTNLNNNENNLNIN